MVSNQRQSYRFPVQDELADVVVQRGRKKWPGRLTDESAGGFSFTTAAKAGLKPGDTVTLHTRSGSFAVEVMHVHAEGDQAQIGARRFVDDLKPQARLGAARSWLDPGTQAAPRSISSLVSFAVYVGAAVLVAWLLLFKSDWFDLSQFLGR